MSSCSICGKETESSKVMCDDCFQLKVKQTWKRQMRVYGIAMLVGVLMLVYAYMQFSNQHYTLGDAPWHARGAMMFGGLALMGGGFGFAIAFFFQLWHGKSK